MPKQAKPDKAAQDGAETQAKIAAACLKLAAKFQEKAQRAAERVKAARSEDKRAMHRRRFELYGDAATELGDRARSMKSGARDRDD